MAAITASSLGSQLAADLTHWHGSMVVKGALRTGPAHCLRAGYRNSKRGAGCGAVCFGGWCCPRIAPLQSSDCAAHLADRGQCFGVDKCARATVPMALALGAIPFALHLQQPSLSINTPPLVVPAAEGSFRRHGPGVSRLPVRAGGRADAPSAVPSQGRPSRRESVIADGKWVAGNALTCVPLHEH